MYGPSSNVSAMVSGMMQPVMATPTGMPAGACVSFDALAGGPVDSAAGGTFEDAGNGASDEPADNMIGGWIEDDTEVLNGSVNDLGDYLNDGITYDVADNPADPSDDLTDDVAKLVTERFDDMAEFESGDVIGNVIDPFDDPADIVKDDVIEDAAED